MTLLDANVVSNAGPKIFGAVLLGVTVIWALISDHGGGQEGPRNLNSDQKAKLNEKIKDGKVR